MAQPTCDVCEIASFGICISITKCVPCIKIDHMMLM
jgi:hypothetical protein